MALKHWRRMNIADEELGIVYVSQSRTVASARKTQDGWSYQTPGKKAGRTKTKARAKAIVKRYVKNNSS